MHYTLDGVFRVRDALNRSTSIQAVRLSLGNDSWLQTGARLLRQSKACAIVCV